MRRFLVRLSESEASNHTPSLADFTITTPELEFSVHTGGVCQQCGKAYQPQRSSSRFCSPVCRQRAHYRKLSFRLNVRTETILQDQSMTSDSSEVFRYVRHIDVQRFAAQGWEPLPALERTHHGEYSVLMRRGGSGGVSYGGAAGGSPPFTDPAITGSAGSRRRDLVAHNFVSSPRTSTFLPVIMATWVQALGPTWPKGDKSGQQGLHWLLSCLDSPSLSCWW
jgi:hypothetical protein